MKADLDYAIQEHSAWKTKFRDFLNGKTSLNVQSIGETDQCKFGQWLEGEGKRLLPQQHLDEIVKLHTEFHRIAAEVIRKIKQKDFAGARSDIAAEGAFNQASLALVKYMSKPSLHAPSKNAPASAPAAETQPAEKPPSPIPPEDGQKSE